MIHNVEIHKTEDVPMVVIKFLTDSVYLSKGEIVGFMQSQSLDISEIVTETSTEPSPILLEEDNDIEELKEQKREVTMDSYSESISSNDEESSDDRTVTADSDSSAIPDFKEVPCKWETDSTGIEANLHKIADGLQSGAEGYLALASHISKVAPYELLQVVAQTSPPPMDVPIPV